MIVIHKYSAGQPIEAPIRRFLDAQIQNDTIVIWAEIDTQKPNRKFDILAVWTGTHIEDDWIYIGTVQSLLVYHIYAVECT